jgi:hypothetical protein
MIDRERDLRRINDGRPHGFPWVDDEQDARRLRWIASDAPAKREPPPLGLFENETVGVIDVCSVLARRLVRIEEGDSDAGTD